MQEILNNKFTWLSAIAFPIVIALIAFRSSLGFGPILAAGLISYILFWLGLRETRRRGNRSRIAAVGYYAMTAVFLLWLVSFVYIEFNVISEGKSSDVARGEYAIVLGAGLKGEEPSVSLSSRLQKASEYLKQNRGLKVIVSGGQGQGEAITEAEAMKRYLIARGIEDVRIIEEDKATSTRENLIFSEKILEAFHVTQSDNIIVITSDYHAFRTKMLAKDLGLKISVLPSKTPLGVYISGCIREYFAVVDTFLLRILTGY
jgi:uncharacterized SAM-binding protein YcdF (DUF218 family)